MTDRAGEQEAIKAKFKRDGDCSAFKVFNLGSNGAVYVGCGLPEYHDKNGDESIYYHTTKQYLDDGSVVTFRWPL